MFFYYCVSFDEFIIPKFILENQSELLEGL